MIGNIIWFSQSEIVLVSNLEKFGELLKEYFRELLVKKLIKVYTLLG